MINPSISLLNELGNPMLPASISSSSTKATLKYYSLPADWYVVRVTGTATAPARGYYTFKLDVK